MSGFKGAWGLAKRPKQVCWSFKLAESGPKNFQLSTTLHEYSTGPVIGASHFAKDSLANLLLVHASDGTRISQHYTELAPSTPLPSETESLAAKLQHPGTLILTCFYPRDPSIQILRRAESSSHRHVCASR